MLSRVNSKKKNGFGIKQILEVLLVMTVISLFKLYSDAVEELSDLKNKIILVESKYEQIVKAIEESAKKAEEIKEEIKDAKELSKKLTNKIGNLEITVKTEQNKKLIKEQK